MASRRLALASVLILVTSCLAQDRGDPREAVTLIRDVLSGAHVSGSLAYWGRCDSMGQDAYVPKLRARRSGSPPLQTLREMFVDVPKMLVTQEGGNIRMVETDVPSDLLDVRISHISFTTHPDPIDTPDKALLMILFAPEVRDFMKAHEIAQPPDSFPISFLSARDSPHMSGDLYNVTVSQALDYVLRTFPGLWTYENCPSEKGGRIVFFNFFQNAPPAWSQSRER